MLTRRAFLKIAGLSALAASGCAPRGGGSGTSEPPSSAPVSGPPTAAPTPASKFAGAPTQLVITPTSQLYVQSYDEVARVNEADWSLTMDGLVENPLSLSQARLRTRASAGFLPVRPS